MCFAVIALFKADLFFPGLTESVPGGIFVSMSGDNRGSFSAGTGLVDS